MAPAVASAIVNEDPTDITKWRNVWIIAIVIMIVESIFFIIFADGKPQKWNFPDKERVNTENKKDWTLVISPTLFNIRMYSSLFQIIFTICVAMAGVSYAGIMMGLHT